jgi:hypothetical protein
MNLNRMPKWARKFIFGFLAAILCKRHLLPEEPKLKVKLQRFRENGVHTITNEEVTNVSSIQEDLTEIKNVMRSIANRFDDTDSRDAITEEWRMAVRITDSLFFAISLACVLATFLYFFLVSTYP